jgi:hypothetical protein
LQTLKNLNLPQKERILSHGKESQIHWIPRLPRPSGSSQGESEIAAPQLGWIPSFSCGEGPESTDPEGREALILSASARVKHFFYALGRVASWCMAS